MLSRMKIMLVGALGLGSLAPAAMAHDEDARFATPAHYETRYEQVQEPGRWVTEEQTVTLPGHGESFDRVVCVPAHFEMRTVGAGCEARQVRVWVPESRRTVCDRRWIAGQTVTKCVQVFKPGCVETRAVQVLVPATYAGFERREARRGEGFERFEGRR